MNSFEKFQGGWNIHQWSRGCHLFLCKRCVWFVAISECNWAQMHGGQKYNRTREKESGLNSCFLSEDKFSGLTKEWVWKKLFISICSTSRKHTQKSTVWHWQCAYICESQQDFKQKNGLSPGYCRAEDLQPSSWTDLKNSRWMKYSSMKQRMAFAFMQKMCLIRCH